MQPPYPDACGAEREEVSEVRRDEVFMRGVQDGIAESETGAPGRTFAELDDALASFVCAQCGREVVLKTAKARANLRLRRLQSRSGRLFCGSVCFDAYRTASSLPLERFTCAHCGREVVAQNNHESAAIRRRKQDSRSGRIYCGRTCFQAARGAGGQP